jgi:hypothetical protein
MGKIRDTPGTGYVPQTEVKLYFPRLIMAVYIITMLFTVMNGCTRGRHEADIEGISLDIEIRRLDRDLFAIDIDSIQYHLARITKNYGDFFDIYNHLIIRIGDARSAAYEQQLRRFLTDIDIYRLQKETQAVFPDLDDITSEIEKSFRRYKYFFPGYPVPRVYTFISGFNQSVVVADSILAIGLDKYLGPDHSFYSQLQLPLFQRNKMYPAKIPADGLIGWAMTEFEFNDEKDDLISNMIYQGKMLYFADRVLPDHHDTIKTGFSRKQLEWCKKNERQMWTYLVENKILFSTDAKTIDSFINEGPFTSVFPRESPARAAVWLGWRIVENYMRRNPHITLEQLMLEHDYHLILNNARYRP